MYVIARRALPDVAISSKPTIDYVDSVLPLRRFFTSFRMTMFIEFLVRVVLMRRYHKKLNLSSEGCRYNARQKCRRWVVLDVRPIDGIFC